MPPGFATAADYCRCPDCIGAEIEWCEDCGAELAPSDKTDKCADCAGVPEDDDE